MLMDGMMAWWMAWWHDGWHVHWHKSAMGVHVSPILSPLPPPSPPHPSGSSQSTGFDLPASCMERALAIRFTDGNIHVSVLFSQIIPPSPSPRVPKSVFMSFLLPCVWHRCSYLSKFHLYVLIYSLCFSFCLTSLCIVGSSFIHRKRINSDAFLLMVEYYAVVQIYHSLLALRRPVHT